MTSERFRPANTWMKLPLAVLLMLLYSAAAHAQGGNMPPEPATAPSVYYLDSTQLVPLESQPFRLKQDIHGLGLTGGTVVYQVKGETSPLRIKSDTPEFVVKLVGDADPLESLLFLRLTPEGGSRVVSIEDFNGLGDPTRQKVVPVDFNADRYGTASFKLFPVHPLSPGEYCLSLKGKNLAPFPGKALGFCFGLDPAGSAVDSAPSPHSPPDGFFSVVYYLNASRQPVELEREIVTSTIKGGKVLMSTSGEISPVRLGASSELHFIVRVTEDSSKASASIQLFRFEPLNGARQFSFLLLTSKNGDPRNSVKLTAEKYGASSLKLTPVEPLLPGEYCISRNTIVPGFCFGVDPPANP